MGQEMGSPRQELGAQLDSIDEYTKRINGPLLDKRERCTPKSDEPFFSERYSKPWCRMEWVVNRSALLNRREGVAAFPVSLEDTKIPDWTSLDFGILLRGKGPQQIAGLILEKVASKGSALLLQR